MKGIGIALAASLSVGCAAAPRFKDQPIVWRVDDARSIAEPAENEYLKLQYLGDAIAMRRLTRLMEVHATQPARDTNALDEVPDSTWFENRIGRRAISIEDVKRGPGEGPPVPPLVITSAKAGGGGEGFIVKDATKRSFLIKFDNKPYPDLETTTDAIVSRLFWAIGYNVPSNNVFVLKRADVSIDPKATFKDELHKKHPFTTRELEKALADSPRRADGDYRVLASELLPGKPKGGASPEGVRDDDPNDRIPHEHRRVLRGLRVFAAWLGHTDMKLDNTLDMYVDEGGRRFLRHYLLDFGEALGSHAAGKERDEDGYEHVFDWKNQGKALVAFGLWKRPWEDRIHTRWSSVGPFASADFDPVGWREAYPYFPFFEADDADTFWGAKIAMRVTRAHIAAAVEAAQVPDPEAAAYLVETIVRRRDKVGAAWLDDVTALDDFRVRPGALCATDLVVRHELASGGEVERLEGGDVVERAQIGSSGDVCVRIPTEDRYAVLRLRTRRGGARPVMQVHVRGGARPRVLGVIRVE